jgi:hypothetical protein
MAALRIGCAATLLLFAATSVAQTAEPSDYAESDLIARTGLRQHGWDFGLWGWAYYSVNDQEEYDKTWGAELELDITKTFAKRLSLAADVEYINYDDHQRGNFEQLFASTLLSPDSGIVLTVGKFNAPFGAESRDYWDRYTATPSLAFISQPQDLRGVMLTTPLGNTDVTLRSFIVSGFSDESTIPSRPSFGMMAEYKPNSRIDLAITGWVGPGVLLPEGSYGWGDDYDAEAAEYSQMYQNLELANGWTGAEFETARKGALYFIDAYAIL